MTLAIRSEASIVINVATSSCPFSKPRALPGLVVQVRGEVREVLHRGAYHLALGVKATSLGVGDLDIDGGLIKTT